MAENGPIPDPDLLSLYHSKYLYFTTWNGLLTEQNSEEHIKHVYDHDSVITRDELPGFKADVEPDTDENEALERSEEHTSELQSRFDLVCRLLLETTKLKSTNRR